MRALNRHVAAVVAVLAIGVGIAAEGAGQAPNPFSDLTKGAQQGPTVPGLQPGEFYVTTRNGCGVIAGPLPTTPPPAGQPPQTEASIRTFYAEREWTGECRHGLLQGVGELQTPELRRKAADPIEGRGFGTANVEYYLGTPLFVSSGRPWFAAGTYTRVLHPDGRSIYSQNVQFPPAWGWSFTASGFNSVPMEPETKVVGADKAMAQTVKDQCSVAARTDPSLRCARGQDYTVYGVKSGVEGGASQTTWCPDPRTSVGCEGLWRTVAQPILVSNAQFLEEVKQADTARRAELDVKLASYVAGYAAAQKARNDAQRAAETAAIAAKEKEARAFRTSLATAGAGQLFTMADELDRAGETEKARQARAALINRFENSPLAAQAAAQLGGGGAGAAPAARAPGAASSASPPSSSIAPEACFQRMNEEMMRLDESCRVTPGAPRGGAEVLIYLGNAGLGVIERYRSCLAPQTYADNVNYRTSMRNAAQRSCSGISSTGSCGPVTQCPAWAQQSATYPGSSAQQSSIGASGRATSQPSPRPTTTPSTSCPPGSMYSRSSGTCVRCTNGMCASR